MAITAMPTFGCVIRFFCVADVIQSGADAVLAKVMLYIEHIYKAKFDKL